MWAPCLKSNLLLKDLFLLKERHGDTPGNPPKCKDTETWWSNKCTLLCKTVQTLVFLTVK